MTRTDDGEGKKGFPQSHWDGGKWVNGNPDEVKLQVPIYRYVEVQAAISRDELIFVVEGEATADVLWKLGIPATTTIGGSGSYGNYGNYLNDLTRARLVLCPDRDANGLKYMSNFERDFESQIEGWYLAGSAGLWRNPQGGMDIHDDLRDHDYSKEQLIERMISPTAYMELVTSRAVGGELLVPPVEDGKLYFTSSWEDGLNRETSESTPKGDTKRVRKLIGNHIEGVGYVKNPEGGGTGILLEFRTQRHELQRLVIPRTALIGDGLDALRAIVDRGYHYNLDSRKCLLAYLFGLGGEIERVYTISDKTGWVNGSFVTPAKTYGDQNLCFRDPEPDNSLTEIKGTLEGWKTNVAAKCAGNSRLIFSLGTAFAAALLEPAQIESGGFHLVGETSIGKTTSLYVAASVAGVKNLPSWRSTSNALEGKAAEFNHGLLPLDEINQADAQTVGASAYMLGNGQGKSRMAKTLNTIKPKTWQLLFLSSGEVSMTDYVRQAKITLKGGQEARMPSIPADLGKGYGAFEDIHGYDTPKKFVDVLEASIREQQGTALDAYLTQLVETRKATLFDKELRERVHSSAAKLSQQYPDPVIGRVAVRFALVQVGLELAYSYNLLPFTIEQCGWAVQQMFDAWLDVRGGAGSIEIKEACNRIEHLFVSNQHNVDRIADAASPQGTRNLLAYRSNDMVTDGVEYWVPQSIFNKEFADGVEKSQLIKELQARGWLKPSLDNRHQTIRRSIGGNRTWFYVFHQFWNDEKRVIQVIQVIHPSENSSDTDVQPGSPWITAENASDPGDPGIETDWITWITEENANDPGDPDMEPKPSNDLAGGGSPGSLGSLENHVFENSPEKNHQFQVGDRVKYISNEPDFGIPTGEVLTVVEDCGEEWVKTRTSGKKPLDIPRSYLTAT